MEKFPEVATIVQANRAFLVRAVRHVVRQGVPQFIDFGLACRPARTRMRSRGRSRPMPGCVTWTTISSSWRTRERCLRSMTTWPSRPGTSALLGQPDRRGLATELSAALLARLLGIRISIAVAWQRAFG
jgi:S-adenosyl methyltransferase